MSGTPSFAAAHNGYVARERCPCCDAPASQAVARVASAPTAESLPVEAHGKFLSGYAAKRVFFSYVECAACTALYCPVYYSQEQLNRLYSRQAENMSEAPLSARLKTQAAYVRMLMKHSRREGSFLEIGADIGIFAEACAREGKFERYVLYEPNVEVHASIRSRLDGRRLEIRTDTFGPEDMPAGSISTAAMIHVVDHLLQPLEAMRSLYQVLEPGGVVLIATHDASSLLARCLGPKWPPFTLQHPQLFTPDSLTLLLQRAGLRTLRIQKTPNYFPFFYLVRAACLVFGLPPKLVAFSGGPMLGLRLGNIAAIARRPVS